jgi:oligopeptide transport system ATP-binding protein
MNQPILKVQDLNTYFSIRGGLLLKEIAKIHAVDGVSFDIKKGRIMGLVGESGCGKTTLAKSILRLIEPTKGKIFFDGIDITKLGKEEMQKIRRRMQMIFQDPYTSLSPRMTIGDIISEPLDVHRITDGQDKLESIKEMLKLVGLSEEHIDRYPHQFSGGQQQRIGIARAMIMNPEFIIADEPVHSLDVSVRAQILNLINSLQQKLGLTILFISHDLSIVQYMSDFVAVMYLGKILEMADTDTLYNNPLHPYTKALIAAVPIADPTIKKKRILLSGSIPTPINPPLGCRFQERCIYNKPRCNEEPKLKEYENNHWVACHFI